MNRLQSEVQRLYLPSSRAMVMALGAPADWVALSKVWRGVQADLQLPAPAIAISGHDALQLWFSLHAPIPLVQAAEFLERLRTRYLPDIALKRLRLGPTVADAQLPSVPSQASTGYWSAFVAPDLAPIFADMPWLDIEPSAEGQADLLSRLQSISPAGLEAALRLLPAVARAATVPSQGASSAPARDVRDVDPRRFLQTVLNDETVELALRIDAAKALLGC